MKVFLKDILKFRAMTIKAGGIKQLAKDAGVSVRTIENLLYNSGIGATTSFKLCRALGVKFDDIFLLRSLSENLCG